MSVLATKGVVKRFSGLQALRGVDIEAGSGEILGLVGPNGSGKTTLMNLCNGVYRPDAGDVVLSGERVNGLGPTALARKGVSRTFQAPRVFDSLTVYQNMRIPLIHSATREKDVEAAARELLERLALDKYLHHVASELSGGQKKLLEFGRALMSGPTLMLMDEPFAGVHPAIKQHMTEGIRAQREKGVSFILVSHELPLMVRLVDRMVCLAEGQVIATGSAEVVCRDERVIDAYLGTRRRV